MLPPLIPKPLKSRAQYLALMLSRRRPQLTLRGTDLKAALRVLDTPRTTRVHLVEKRALVSKGCN